MTTYRIIKRRGLFRYEVQALRHHSWMGLAYCLTKWGAGRDLDRLTERRDPQPEVIERREV